MKNKTPVMLALLAAVLFAASWALGYFAGRVRGNADSRLEFAGTVWLENVGDEQGPVILCTAELAGTNPRSIIPPGARVRLEAYWPGK